MNNISSPFKYKKLNLKNRIVLAPMCQYCVENNDGIPTEWHHMHYVSRSIGGTGLIMFEMTSISKNGRSTNKDLGIWSDDHIDSFSKIVKNCKIYGASVCLQISHAGRKAQDTDFPVSSSPVKFPGKEYNKPRELTKDEIKILVEDYANAARRGIQAGFDAIELHGAHGYLIHQFHSPFMNKRSDEYGENLERFGVEVIRAVKKELLDDIPLIMRVSAVEYSDGGYDLEHIIKICEKYKQSGVDLFSISSGGEGEFPKGYPAHQVPFAREIKKRLNVPVIVAGGLNDPNLADAIVRNGETDLVAVGRGMLTNPYWTVSAMKSLNYQVEIPKQYKLGFLYKN